MTPLQRDMLKYSMLQAKAEAGTVHGACKRQASLGAS